MTTPLTALDNIAEVTTRKVEEKLELLEELEEDSWEKLKTIISNDCKDGRFLDRIIKVQTIRKELNNARTRK